MGLSVGIGGNVDISGIQGASWSGVRWDPTLPGSAMTRVGDANWQQLFQDISLVALSDTGVINAVLATYSSPTILGATDGSNGQAMTRIPKKYYREIFNTAGEMCGIDMSNYPLLGFTLHEKFSWGNGRDAVYCAAFEGSTVAGKYQSISNAVLDSSKTLAQFHGYAVARGSGYHEYDLYTHDLLQKLFYIHYADLNSQLVLPAYSEHTWVDGHEKRKTGRTLSLTTMNGYVNADAVLDADIATGWNNASRVIANRFLWIENFYGHCWKFFAGVVYDGRTGQPNTAWVTPDPTKFSSVDAEILSRYTNLNINLPASPNENYIKSFGHLFMPVALGGNSATYTCDYFWSYLDDTTRNYLHLVLSGGSLSYGGLVGVAARDSAGDLGRANAGSVSRLCYESN